MVFLKNIFLTIGKSTMKIFTVDAFTAKPFAGNPAAVCLVSGPVSETWMQQVAQEMNLSETAFVYAVKDGFNLQWFTPTTEVDLCGHATLATAFVLWEANILGRNETAHFHTKSGLLTARIQDSWIELDFPAEPALEVETPTILIEALGVHPLYIGKNRFDYIVEVASEQTLMRIQPDFAMLAKLSVRGIIVTSKSNQPSTDFVSRFFGPAASVNEDPVTGSAHCCLGPYWQKKINKDNFTAYQASSRGGIVKLQVYNDRVKLMGQAVMIMRGELTI
jgi:PhzF family phenazine biosynthesis protein